MAREFDIPDRCPWCDGYTDSEYPIVTCMDCGSQSKYKDRGDSLSEGWGLWSVTAKILPTLLPRITKAWDHFPAKYEFIEQLVKDLEEAENGQSKVCD